MDLTLEQCKKWFLHPLKGGLTFLELREKALAFGLDVKGIKQKEQLYPLFYSIVKNDPPVNPPVDRAEMDTLINENKALHAQLDEANNRVVSLCKTVDELFEKNIQMSKSLDTTKDIKLVDDPATTNTTTNTTTNALTHELEQLQTKFSVEKTLNTQLSLEYAKSLEQCSLAQAKIAELEKTVEDYKSKSSKELIDPNLPQKYAESTRKIDLLKNQIKQLVQDTDAELAGTKNVINVLSKKLDAFEQVAKERDALLAQNKELSARVKIIPQLEAKLSSTISQPVLTIQSKGTSTDEAELIATLNLLKNLQKNIDSQLSTFDAIVDENIFLRSQLNGKGSTDKQYILLQAQNRQLQEKLSEIGAPVASPRVITDKNYIILQAQNKQLQERILQLTEQLNGVTA